MRYSISIAAANALAQHNEAYAIHDKLAEAGDDHSPEAVAAAKAEYETLHAFLTMPATHPGDVAAKLQLMAERRIDASWDWHAEVMASITNDCARMTRDCPSPAMVEAFNRWADLRRAVHAEYEREGHTDETVDAIDVERREAFLALTRLPLNAPGDWMVKAYTNGLEALGATGEDALGMFEIDRAQIDLTIDGSHDIASAHASLDDIEASDLGRCMMTLGRVEFDAAAWLEASERAGIVVNVILQDDARRTLCLTDTTDSDSSGKQARCQYLLNADGDKVEARKRHKAVADHITGTRDDLVSCYHAKVGA